MAEVPIDLWKGSAIFRIWFITRGTMLALLILGLSIATDAKCLRVGQARGASIVKPLTAAERAFARSLPMPRHDFKDEPPMTCPTIPEDELGRNYESNRSWLSNEIPYTIDSLFILGAHARIMIAKAVSHIEEKTGCIKFVGKRENKPYVLIQTPWKNGGCTTNRLDNGNVVINLEYPRCASDVPMIIHELMHAMSGLHEHQRSDRDFYVYIDENHMAPSRKGDFAKVPEEGFKRRHKFWNPYDFASQLHYKPKWASKDGKDVIIPLVPTDIMRNDVGLSTGDITKIRQEVCGLIDKKPYVCYRDTLFREDSTVLVACPEGIHGRWTFLVEKGYVIEIAIFFSVKRKPPKYCTMTMIDPYRPNLHMDCYRRDEFVYRSAGNRLYLTMHTAGWLSWRKVPDECCKRISVTLISPGGSMHVYVGEFELKHAQWYAHIPHTLPSGADLEYDNSTGHWFVKYMRPYSLHHTFLANGYVKCAEYLTHTLSMYDPTPPAGTIKVVCRQGCIVNDWTTKVTYNKKGRRLETKLCRPGGTWGHWRLQCSALHDVQLARCD